MIKRTMFGGGSKLLFEKAAAMRNQSTYEEMLRWSYLSTKPLGFKFRRQHVYSAYILDFYCHRLKLVIEVDGLIHNKEESQIVDRERQQQLENCGLHFLRFTNRELRNNLDQVQKTIEDFILTKGL